MIYIQNLIKDNQNLKEKYKKNILIDLKQFFNRCTDLEKERDENEEDEVYNINLNKIFSTAFIRVYVKIFIEWINKNQFSKYSEIQEIRNLIKGRESNKFREMMQYYLYKIVYNMHQQNINKLFEKSLKN